VTSPTRTIEDLRRNWPSAGGANSEQLRRALRQAATLGLDVGPIGEVEGTRSDLDVNVEVGGIEVDFLWRKRRLVVETDGYRYHRGEIAFEDDRHRDLVLRNLGFDVVRLSYTQVTAESGAVAATLRSMLAAP